MTSEAAVKFRFIVTVETDTQEHADQVMGERLGCDEDYGFDYLIEWLPQQFDDYVARFSMQPMPDPYEEARRKKGAVASNTRDCFRAVVGHTIKGVLFDAMPPNRHDLRQGNKTLVFEDGTGLTISNNGSFWLESKEDVDRACRLKAKELADLQRETADVLNAAGWGGAHNDGSGGADA